MVTYRPTQQKLLYQLNIRKSISRFSLILFGAYLLLHFFFYVFQKQIVFQPDRLQYEYTFNFNEEFEEFFIPTGNEKINAIYFKTNKEKIGVVLYLHGNSDNLSRWGKYADDFTSRGYDVLMIDYRGYGKSDGNASEENFYEDAYAAYKWLSDRVEYCQLVIYGRSLGSGPATYLAAHNDAKMLILETPFENIECVEKAKLPFLFFPFCPKLKFPNDQYIQKVAYPVYIFHGTADDVVPYKCAKGLEQFLKPGDEFYTIEGGGHKNLNEFKSYFEQLDTILIKK